MIVVQGVQLIVVGDVVHLLNKYQTKRNDEGKKMKNKIQIITMVMLVSGTATIAAEPYYICLPCPKGTYSKDNECVPCAPGQYNDVVGSSSCKPCPTLSASMTISGFTGHGSYGPCSISKVISYGTHYIKDFAKVDKFSCCVSTLPDINPNCPGGCSSSYSQEEMKKSACYSEHESCVTPYVTANNFRVSLKGSCNNSVSFSCNPETGAVTYTTDIKTCSPLSVQGYSGANQLGEGTYKFSNCERVQNCTCTTGQTSPGGSGYYTVTNGKETIVTNCSIPSCNGPCNPSASVASCMQSWIAQCNNDCNPYTCTVDGVKLQSADPDATFKINCDTVTGIATPSY